MIFCVVYFLPVDKRDNLGKMTDEKVVTGLLGDVVVKIKYMWFNQIFR